MIKSSILIICCIAFCGSVTSFDQTAKILPERKVSLTGFTNAAEYGFSTDSSGIKNTKALQLAVDQTGTIIVSQPGTYKMAGTVYTRQQYQPDFWQ